MLYDAKYITCWKQQNYEEHEQIMLASAREEGWINRWSAGEFQSHATVPLCRTATVASVQIQRGTGGRGGPNVNLS